LSERSFKWLIRACVTAVVLIVAVPGTVYAILRSTVPPPSGAIAIASLDREVEIVRDHEGVPHIFAATFDDLYTALGFTHAQERLWQMELLRRSAQGRLSEIFGERTLSTDIFLRTLDLYGHAERSVAHLPSEARAALEAYARGVNAFIERRTALLEWRLPPEFLLLGHSPEPWRAADSVAVLKVLALMLSANLREEMTRLAYAARGFTSAEIADLMPVASEGAPELPQIDRLIPLRRMIGELPLPEASAIEELAGKGASNNWVVAGSRTRSGKPLLANDPHLRLSAPVVWYLVHLALMQPGAGTANVVGASLPGTPLVVLGRGDSMAWGFTNTRADVEDLFIEKVNPDNPAEYLAPEGWRQFITEDMTIRVRGGATRIVQRRRTRHGPVLPASYQNLGSLLADGHVAALAWTALSDDDTTIAAGLFHARVRTVADYVERMRLYIVPMQSMVVADAEGSIGLIAPGRVPVRDPANLVAGRAPVPGWDAAYDWKGYIKFEDLPRVIDPPEGAIATANARITGIGKSPLLTWDWESDSRQQRLQELIVGRSGHDMASMRAAQADVFSPEFARLKPLMIAAARKADGADRAVLDRLNAWDATMRSDAAEPLIFMAWLSEALKAVYRDDLGTAFASVFDAKSGPALTRILEGGGSARDWCDDRTTEAHETCATELAGALRAALEDLDRRYGRDRSSWTWGAAHYALAEHRPLGQLSMIGTFFNIQVPSAGGPDTLNRGQVSFGEEPPFANRLAATFRAIYDFNNLDGSLYIDATGQSGNPFSQFYRNFAERWSKGRYIRIPVSRAEIDKSALGTWLLRPE
jgi:penicillin amidase